VPHHERRRDQAEQDSGDVAAGLQDATADDLGAGLLGVEDRNVRVLVGTRRGGIARWQGSGQKV
jgi:hypothetical protein